ncbi:MAG: thiol peroxidase [Eudoraea sp.]|nr:thiol peroxidase [Eudoraea sp.]
MALIHLTGTSANTVGDLPKKGDAAPDFTLTKNDFSSVSLTDYKGKKVVLNIFLSVDTGTCSNSIHAFNSSASQLENTVVLCISKDLPFAINRFCGAEGITNLEMLTDYKDGKFGNDYGVTFKDGPLESLFSRAVVVLDESSTVIYTEHVPQIVDEPNYEAALEALKNA